MDIIASHQLGLIEQFRQEAVELAGRPRDSAQRAIVYHHVADMLGLVHGYALLAAHGALAIDGLEARIARRARGAWWRLKRGERSALAGRIAEFGDTLRRLDADRCAELLTMYRLCATPGLGGEAERRLDPGLLSAMRAAQSRRGHADAAVRRALFVAHQQWAEALIGARLDQAIAALDWPLAPRAIDTAVATLRVPTRAFDHADRSGLKRSEARLRASDQLPAGFAGNPAQAFFRLQRNIAERRRRAADDAYLSPDDAVSLAA